MLSFHRLLLLFPAALSLTALLAAPAHSQTPYSAEPRLSCPDTAVWSAPSILGTGGELARVAELAGFGIPRSRVLSRASTDALVAACGEPPAYMWGLLDRASPKDGAAVSLLPASTLTYFNSTYARNEEQTGAIWAGRGLSTAVSAGAAFRWGPLSAEVAPIFVFQQNSEFDTRPVELPGMSPFAHTSLGWVIDLPQRHGADPLHSIEAGQSYLRLDLAGVGAGVSTENRRIGPMLRNPLLMGYAGPGFTHAFLGMSRPRSIGIGELDVQAFWARLRESDFWDADPANDTWLMGAMSIAFAPRGIPGLVLGLSRVHHLPIPDEGLQASDYINVIVDLPLSQYSGNLAGNGLAAIFARWTLPGSGFEAYGEWGRDDYSWDWTHLMKEPDHTRAYAVGVQQVVRGETRALRLNGEITYLGAASPLRGGSGAPSFYTHGEVAQGHTHRGQPLGAFIGPGADAQFVAADMLYGTGVTGIYLERVRFNTDGYYASWARYYGSNGHDVEITAALRHAHAFRGLHMHAVLAFSRRENRDFLDLDGINWDFRVERNVGLRLGLSTAVPGMSSITPHRRLR